MIETDLIPKQIAALGRMTVGQLQKRYAEVFGETARSGNKQSLFRRIEWRIQALDEGADHEGRQGMQPQARGRESVRIAPVPQAAWLDGLDRLRSM